MKVYVYFDNDSRKIFYSITHYIIKNRRLILKSNRMHISIKLDSIKYYIVEDLYV